MRSEAPVEPDHNIPAKVRILRARSRQDVWSTQTLSSPRTSSALRPLFSDRSRGGPPCYDLNKR